MPDDRPAPRPSLRVRPFRGWRFTDGTTQTYVGPEETAGVAPLPRMMRAVLAVDQDDAPASAAGRERVRRQLERWRSEGVLAQDRKPGLYLYRRVDDSGPVVGLIGAISVHPPRDRVVVPHEDVDPVMVERQASLMAAFEGQPEPVVTVHHGTAGFRAAVATVLETAPTSTVHTVGARHELWRVSEARLVAALCDELVGTTLLLADGHHRYAAFRDLQRRSRAPRPAPGPAPWELGLALLVDEGDTGLRLGPIHRVVPHVDVDRVRSTPGIQLMPVTTADRADGGCVLSDGRTSWALHPQPIASRTAPADAAELLIALLHREWLPHWGVAPTDVSYVHDAGEAVGQARRTHGLAVLMPAPTIDAVFDAAASGNLMPAKATSFQPKPLIGQVMRHWPGGETDL
jgi:uncharacterized protein (DUF1015 family)